MKIERINENSIRCTLTRDDLEERQVKLSEIAYGTEKAKMLFHDMMMQASKELGFEANDIPLMIEAIPGAGDSIILNITKVENPDDIDSKFSKLGSLLGDPGKTNSLLDRMKKLDGAEDVLDILRHVTEAVKALPATEEPKSEVADADSDEDTVLPLRFFSFSTLDSVIRAASLLADIYNGANTLYKDDIADFMKDMFGNQIDYIVGKECLIEDYNYVYSYNELINSYIADAIVVLLDGTEIFLYEIDD